MADYGIDWGGPYGFDDLGGQAQRVAVPQVQLQQQLTEENTARLPDPNVPFMDPLDIYTATLQQLMQWHPELDEFKLSRTTICSIVLITQTLFVNKRKTNLTQAFNKKKVNITTMYDMCSIA